MKDALPPALREVPALTDRVLRDWRVLARHLRDCPACSAVFRGIPDLREEDLAACCETGMDPACEWWVSQQALAASLKAR